ncbi:MAG: VIT1/CCC1 transporter family protein [Candidatus Binatia bacterium]|nr:VIT1/CCC1 transporter family protein [Candidatus Binatia bacterium]
MMREELGIQEDRVDPFMSGLVTFAAFSLACSLPLFPYVMAYFIPIKAFPLSVGMTGTALFVVGAARHFMTRRPW